MGIEAMTTKTVHTLKLVQNLTMTYLFVQSNYFNKMHMVPENVEK